MALAVRSGGGFALWAWPLWWGLSVASPAFHDGDKAAFK